MIDGVMDHADSHGGGGTSSDGDTQWMTAGGGILHKEAPPEWLVQKGGLFHGIQLWVNLPGKEKMVEPKYQDIGRSNVVLLSSHDGGALVRLIAGEVGEFSGPGSTRTPITLWASGTQESRSPNLEVIVLGGRPIGEPVAHYGPFVMNTQEELVKAFEDYQAGRLGTVPAGHA
ncbi:pirin family protein [Streptosporangium sp. NBC_01639]|uniref:pirin family protein n=1 Tax=Streptosporangium sp. NBC_01639 TaxID=2975948 RepID=UPI0038673D1D|nr:pirin family protein [Streptosporangium sp. NBC_01639]